MQSYRIQFESIEWRSPAAGVRDKTYAEGSSVLRLVEYTGEMAPHWCTKGHIGVILEGRFEIEFKSGTHVFESGDGVFIPSGEAHAHRARVLTDVVRAVFVEERETDGN